MRIKRLYIYLDGNGNKYTIINEGKITIEYVPIKLLLSSSSVYDGGDYIKKELSKLQHDKITSILNEVIRNEENHVKNRVKKSGMITIQEKNDKKTFIIGPNSKKLHEIEKTLQHMIKN